MRKFLIVAVMMVLAACSLEPKIDAKSKEAFQESVQKVQMALPEADRDEFQKAILYFSIGGKKGIGDMFARAMAGQETDPEMTMIANMQKIAGLTGPQVLAKYRQALEADRAAEAERAEIKKLKDQAEAYRKSNKFSEALDTYEGMGVYAEGVEPAKEGIADTQRDMEAFEAKQAYISKIKITEFTATRIDTYSDKNVPAVRISLKNEGDRSLDKVKVTVYFEDKDGNVIYENDYHPVLVSRYSFSGDNKPLKPGYVKEMEKDKYYTLDSALTAWKTGNATAKITDIEFSE